MTPTTSCSRARRLILAALLLPGVLAAQGAVPDSGRPPLFTAKDGWRAAGFTLGAVALSTLDTRIARWFADSVRQENRALKEFSGRFNHINETTATVGGLALWGIGRLTKQETLSDVSFHMAEAVFIASVSSQLVRGPLGRARPSVNGGTDQYVFHPFKGFREFDHRSFPSIHTSSGFAAAAVLSNEAKRRWPGQRWWITPAAYTLAATPGLSRMFLGQHWASDVFMGAFVGTVAGQKVIRANHDINPRNRVNRFFLGENGVQANAHTVSFTMHF